MLRALLLFTLIPSLCFAVTLQWDANTDAVAGYRLYYGTEPTAPFTGTGAVEGPSPVDVGNVTQATITLPAGAYYFTVTAYDSSGYESAYSNIVGSAASVIRLNLQSTGRLKGVGQGSGRVNLR